MEKISIAIPTYNSSIYVKESLELLLKTSKTPIFHEIVVNDDNSEIEDFENLLKLINYFSDKHRNVSFSLNRNNKNLGGFKNKYITIKNCSNNFVYQIDSDNLVNKSTLKFLKFSNLNKNYLYLPSKIYLFKNKSLIKRKVSFTKEFGKFSKDKIKQFLITNSNVNKRDLNWVMNIGNPIFFKDRYLEYLEEGMNSKLNLSADAYALTFFWLKNQGFLYLDKQHSHNHRLHDKSYWVTEGQDAIDSVNLFREKIISL